MPPLAIIATPNGLIGVQRLGIAKGRDREGFAVAIHLSGRGQESSRGFIAAPRHEQRNVAVELAPHVDEAGGIAADSQGVGGIGRTRAGQRLLARAAALDKISLCRTRACHRRAIGQRTQTHAQKVPQFLHYVPPRFAHRRGASMSPAQAFSFCNMITFELVRRCSVFATPTAIRAKIANPLDPPSRISAQSHRSLNSKVRLPT